MDEEQTEIMELKGTHPVEFFGWLWNGMEGKMCAV